MGLIIKHALKNIVAKPLRLLLLIFCITFASFTALLAVDMRNNIETLMKGYLMDMIGKMDIMVYNASPDILNGIEDIAEIKKTGIAETGQYEYKRDAAGYEYSFEKIIDVISISDMDAAYEMAIIPECYELDETTCVITQDYADYFEVSEGDTVRLETRDEVEIKLNVIGVVDIHNTFINREGVITTNEIVRKINCEKKNEYAYWMIDVLDDTKIDAVAEVLRGNDPKAELEVISEQMDDADIEAIYNLFYLLFLISFLLVIFVTVSIAEKIVNERMSVIGTLRSLGISQNMTAFVLLMENILYAVIGAIPGILLYSLVKQPLLSSMIGSPSDTVTFEQYIGETPIAVYLLVVLGAVLIECAYPLYELVKAVRVPIRDIIFDNKDTEFKYRWSRLYAGIVLAVIAVISGLLVKNFLTLAVSLVCGTIALAVLIPFAIRILSKGIEKVFRKISFPVAQLAAENISRNRIIMGTAVLCVTSLTLSLLIGGVGEALARDLEKEGNDCDVVVNVNVNDDYHTYRYIGALEGVEEADYIYSMLSTAAFEGDKNRTMTWISDTPHKMVTGLPEEGYGLNENEIVMSSELAAKLGYSVGDEIKLVLSSDTDFPIEQMFILKDTIDANRNGVFDFTSVIIHPDLYEHFFSGSISRIFIRTTDPDGVKERIEKYSESDAVTVYTKAELQEDDAQSAKSLLTVIRVIVGGSAALSMIGIAGNQSLGFLTRKREIALLYSVALPRHKLNRLLFLESLFTMGIAALVAAFSAPLLYQVLGHLLDVIAEGEINILSEGGLGVTEILMYLSVILVVYLLTTLIPAGYLRKMHISEELKYE